MRCEAAAPALVFLDEPEILRRLRASFAQSASRPSSLGYARVVWRWLRCGAGAAADSTATDHRKEIRFAAQRCSNGKVNSSAVRGCEHFTNRYRGSRLSLWRAHKEGHTLFAARAWPGALLATQRHAGNVAAGEAPCPMNFPARWNRLLLALRAHGGRDARAPSLLPDRLHRACRFGR